MMNKMCLFMMAGILLVAQSAVNAATDAAVTASLALSTGNLMVNNHAFGADAKLALTSIATVSKIAHVTHNTTGATVLASTNAVTNTRIVIAHHDQRVSA